MFGPSLARWAAVGSKELMGEGGVAPWGMSPLLACSAALFAAAAAAIRPLRWPCPLTRLRGAALSPGGVAIDVGGVAKGE